MIIEVIFTLAVIAIIMILIFVGIVKSISAVWRFIHMPKNRTPATKNVQTIEWCYTTPVLVYKQDPNIEIKSGRVWL